MAKPSPKRHATSATRKGNGTGYGGPAKGAGADAPMQAPFEAGNQAAKGYHDMSRSDRLAALDERKWMIGMGLVPNVLPVEVAAINSYEVRHLGTPTQTLQHSGPDGGPIPSRVEYAWADLPTPVLTE